MRLQRLDGSTVHEFEGPIRERLRLNRIGKWGYYAHPGLDDFHWNRLVNACKSDSADVWSCSDDMDPVLLFGLGEHNFHTRVFKTAVGRVSPLYLLKPRSNLVRAALKRLSPKGESLGLELLALRIPTSERLLNYHLSTLGWSHVGTSLKLAIERDRWTQCCVDTDISTIYSSYLSEGGSVGLREAKVSDTPQLARLITRAHRHSHFFNDPRLSVSGRKRLFPVWIERSVNGMMDLALIAEQKGVVLGFATCLLSCGLREFVGHEVGVLDFVAVDPDAQGQGIGKHLLRAALAWLFDRVPFVELRTMADNLAALVLYSHLGLVPVGSDHHYHRWLNPARRDA